MARSINTCSATLCTVNLLPMASPAVAKAMVTRPAEVRHSTPACPNCFKLSGWVRRCEHANCTAYTTIGSASHRLMSHTQHPILLLPVRTACIACCHTTHSTTITTQNVQPDTLLTTTTQLCGSTNHPATRAPTKRRKHHDPHCANYLTEVAALPHQGRGSSHQPATQTPIRRTRLYVSRPSSTQPRGG